jgi:CDGSH-type Zn-finger protein/uncharacterized Fe-S cluster protein YjdI
VLAERTRELASAYARAAKDCDPSLQPAADRLFGVASRLEGAAPTPVVTPGTSLPMTTGPAVPVTTAPAVPVTAAPAVEEARGRHLVVRFEGKRCIHSRHCVLGAPDVFRANVKGPWLNPDGASLEAVVAIAHNCPSGAISYDRLDGGPAEAPPPVNVLRVRENGPLAIHAEIDLAGYGRMLRATLCRCGASKNKPFCDSSHAAVGFVATGEPAASASAPLAQRDGSLEISPTPNGPLAITGNIEICSGTGRTVARAQRARLCRCGGSANKPFCDGTHARIGFTAS